MIQPIPFSLSQGCSAIVAEACGELPALTKQTDDTFIRLVFEESLDAFWRMYIDWLPKVAKDALVQAQEDPTGEATVAWHQQYANFAEDTQARAKAEMILVALREKLLPNIAKAYGDWTPEEAAVTEGFWAMTAEEMSKNA